MENMTYTPIVFDDNRSSSGDIRGGDWWKFCLADNLGFEEIKKD